MFTLIKYFEKKSYPKQVNTKEIKPKQFTTYLPKQSNPIKISNMLTLNSFKNVYPKQVNPKKIQNCLP